MQVRFPGYLAAHGGKSLLWHGYDLLFAYFLTAHLRLSPAAMGTIAMALMLFSALTDPLAGWLLGRRTESAPYLIRVQLCGAVLSSIAFLLVFSQLLPLPPLQHAIAAGLLFHIAYKFYDVPQNALSSVLSRDRGDVLYLSAGRYLLSALARIAAACAAWLAIGSATTSSSAAALFALLLVVPALASAWAFAGRVAAAPPPADAAAAYANAGKPWQRLPAALPLLLAAGLLNAGLLSLVSRVFPYLGADSATMITFSVGALVLLPLFQRLALRRGEHRAFAAAAALTALSCAGLPLAFRLDDSVGRLALNALALLYGGGGFACTMLLWGAVANLVHRHDRSTGLRSDTLCYSLYTFASKLGIAGSMIGLSVVLGPATVVPGEADFGGMLGKAAALGVVGCALCAALAHTTLRSLARD